MALRNGSRFTVSMQDVFGFGCALMPDSITEAMDYDERTKVRRPGHGQADRQAGLAVPRLRHGPRAGRPVPRDRREDHQ